MKHTIKGNHGHVYRHLPDDERGVVICVPAGKAAYYEYLDEEMTLREGISKKWKTCLWCYKDKSLYPVRSRQGKILFYECKKMCRVWKSIKPMKKGSKTKLGQELIKGIKEAIAHAK